MPTFIEKKKKNKRLKKDEIGIPELDIKFDNDGTPMINLELEEEQSTLHTPFSYLQMIKERDNMADIQKELLQWFYGNPTSKFYVLDDESGKMREVSKDEFKKEMDEDAD